MIPDVTIPVERFHRVLVDEIQKQRPMYLDGSFTVAEIYQILVPYRSHRDALGVEMNGDYEDALLRLLAGAGDLVVLESDDAKDRILRELQSKNPNTGLFREFAGAGVHLNRDGLPEALRPDGSEAEPSVAKHEGLSPEQEVAAEAATSSVADASMVAGEIKPASTPTGDEPREKGTETTYFDFETSTVDSISDEAVTPIEAASASAPKETTTDAPSQVNGAAPAEDESATARTISLVSATESTSSEPGAGFWKPGEHPVSTTTESTAAPEAHAPQPAARAATTDCSWCDESLPDRSDVNYCPHCGMSTTVKPCSACRSEMEPAWKFCVSCGEQAAAGAS